jgi:hypothetical protein
MLSNLSSSHAPALISHILQSRTPSSGIWQHWRGRYGLTESQQGDIWAQVDKPSQRGFEVDNGIKQEEGKEMVKLRFKTWDGEVRDVEGRIGENLLSVGKRFELEGMEGVCGGNLGTHAYL